MSSGRAPPGCATRRRPNMGPVTTGAAVGDDGATPGAARVASGVPTAAAPSRPRAATPGGEGAAIAPKTAGGDASSAASGDALGARLAGMCGACRGCGAAALSAGTGCGGTCPASVASTAGAHDGGAPAGNEARVIATGGDGSSAASGDASGARLAGMCGACRGCGVAALGVCMGRGGAGPVSAGSIVRPKNGSSSVAIASFDPVAGASVPSTSRTSPQAAVASSVVRRSGARMRATRTAEASGFTARRPRRS